MQINEFGFIKFEVNELSIYKKKDLDVHFVASLDVADKGEKIIVPTLEGNVTIVASSEQLIMLGQHCDIYPIPQKLFDERYDIGEEETEEKIFENLPWDVKRIKKCHLKKETYVYAKEVPVDFKVYVKHCDSIIYGMAGDFYAVSFEDTDNAYIIRKSIMKDTYQFVR